MPTLKNLDEREQLRKRYSDLRREATEGTHEYNGYSHVLLHLDNTRTLQEAREQPASLTTGTHHKAAKEIYRRFLREVDALINLEELRYLLPGGGTIYVVEYAKRGKKQPINLYVVDGENLKRVTKEVDSAMLGSGAGGYTMTKDGEMLIDSYMTPPAVLHYLELALYPEHRTLYIKTL